MGYGSYSVVSSRVREFSDYKDVSREEIFTNNNLDEKMNPQNVLRECRDSEDHPETIPVIIFLDVTGSMGSIPEQFIKKGMTDIMEYLLKHNLKDVQILFGGIGDHECDNVPLQVGQFETNDQLLDQWLKSIYLEGGGGANYGESYLLAWKFAADHTNIDSFEKRSQKGFLFTIGDEKTLKDLPIQNQKEIFGDGQYEKETSDSLLKKAQEKYNVFHIHITETNVGGRKSTQNKWKQLLKDNLLIVQSFENIPNEIAETIHKFSNNQNIIEPVSSIVEKENELDDKEQMML
jgi:hypothetical protein